MEVDVSIDIRVGSSSVRRDKIYRSKERKLVLASFFDL